MANCKNCGEKVGADAADILIGIIFNRPFLSPACPRCQKALNLEEDENLRKIREDLSKRLDSLIERFMPLIIESGILYDIFGENAKIEVIE